MQARRYARGLPGRPVACYPGFQDSIYRLRSPSTQKPQCDANRWTCQVGLQVQPFRDELSDFKQRSAGRMRAGCRTRCFSSNAAGMQPRHPRQHAPARASLPVLRELLSAKCIETRQVGRPCIPDCKTWSPNHQSSSTRWSPAVLRDQATTAASGSDNFCKAMMRPCMRGTSPQHHQADIGGWGAAVKRNCAFQYAHSCSVPK